ncbi:hypothetical protein [Streptomyces sp. NPDC003710]
MTSIPPPHRAAGHASDHLDRHPLADLVLDDPQQLLDEEDEVLVLEELRHVRDLALPDGGDVVDSVYFPNRQATPS